MIKWNEHIYIHNNIKENVSDIISDVYKYKSEKIYVVIKALSDNNLLEIISIAELLNGLYNNRDVEIYGIARGKRNVKEILIDIIEAAVDDKGNININNI